MRGRRRFASWRTARDGAAQQTLKPVDEVGIAKRPARGFRPAQRSKGCLIVRTGAQQIGKPGRPKPFQQRLHDDQPIVRARQMGAHARPCPIRRPCREPCAHGIESTVVDLTSDLPRVLRAGATSLEALRAIVPELIYDAGQLTVVGDAARASPGLASRHYAPRTRVVLADRGAPVAEAALDAARGGRLVGAISWSDEARVALEAAARAGLALGWSTALPAEAAGYAYGLFAALHDADAAALDALVVERVPDAPAWWAVADRLQRASRAAKA